MKFKIVALGCVLISCASYTAPRMTVLFYMIADSSKEAALEFNCRQIERAGVPKNMNLLFYLVKTRQDNPVEYVRGTIVDYTLESSKKKPVGPKGHEALLSQALEWAAQIPAEHFCLVICHEPFSKQSSFARSNFLGTCLARFTQSYLRKPLDLLVFDAGLTSTDQTVVSLSPYVRFMLASQLPNRLIGLPYHLMMNAFREGATEPAALGCALVKAQKEYYDLLTKEYSGVLLDLQALAPLARLLQPTQVPESIYSKFVSAVKGLRVPPFGSKGYSDLRSACKAVLQAIKLKKLQQDAYFKRSVGQILTLVEKGVVCHTRGYPKGCGLSIQTGYQIKKSTSKKS